VLRCCVALADLEGSARWWLKYSPFARSSTSSDIPAYSLGLEAEVTFVTTPPEVPTQRCRPERGYGQRRFMLPCCARLENKYAPARRPLAERLR